MYITLFQAVLAVTVVQTLPLVQAQTQAEVSGQELLQVESLVTYLVTVETTDTPPITVLTLAGGVGVTTGVQDGVVVGALGGEIVMGQDGAQLEQQLQQVFRLLQEVVEHGQPLDLVVLQEDKLCSNYKNLSLNVQLTAVRL